VASKKSDRGTGVFLAHLAVIAVMVVVLATAYIVYVDTKWMQGEIKGEAKKLRKLEDRVSEKLNDLKEREDAIRSSRGAATAGGM